MVSDNNTPLGSNTCATVPPDNTLPTTSTWPTASILTRPPLWSEVIPAAVRPPAEVICTPTPSSPAPGAAVVVSVTDLAAPRKVSTRMRWPAVMDTVESPLPW